MTRFGIILIVLAVACLAGSPLRTEAQAEVADIGRVKRATGEAFVERNGTRLPAEPGLILTVQDVLVTGPDGGVSVTFIDNSRFSAGPDSRVSLNEFEFNATTQEGKIELGIQRGSIAVISGQISKKKRDAMKVRTPTSVLGVRGTRFVVEVKG